MEVLNLILLLIGIFGLLYILEKQLKKWFAIDEQVLESEPAKKIERWSRWTLAIAQVPLIPLTLQFDHAYIYWLLSIFTAITALTVYFEWRLLKGTKKYQLTLATYSLTLLAVLTIIILW